MKFFISKHFPYNFRIFTPSIKSFTFVTIPNHGRRQKKEGDEDD
jgi:hypothetical protein